MAIVASLSGDHRLHVWHSRDGARLSDLLPTAERSIIVSRTQAWLWDSSSMTAVRLGTGIDPAAAAAAQKAASMIDPVELAQQALAAIDPSTRATVAGSTTVAGRDAYVLSLEPRTSATLVGRVELYVDASRWLPLGGAVFARGASSPALSARFTTVSFGSIDPAVYRFTPPPGAKIVTPRGLMHGAAGSCLAGEVSHDALRSDDAGDRVRAHDRRIRPPHRRSAPGRRYPDPTSGRSGAAGRRSWRCGRPASSSWRRPRRGAGTPFRS